MSRLRCGDQNFTSCSRCGRTSDLYNGRISSLFLYLRRMSSFSKEPTASLRGDPELHPQSYKPDLPVTY